MRRITLILVAVALLSAIACRSTDAPEPAAALEIPVEPEAGSYLCNERDEMSGVMLKDVTVSVGVCDRPYKQPGRTTLREGDACLIVGGHIQNQHKERYRLTMHALGYNKAGQTVAWTLESDGIAGQPGRHVTYGATSTFTLHMNPSEEIETIRLYASSYL